MPYQMEYMEPAPLDPPAEQMMVPMRDGVRLATDVYLPERPGRLPAVLVRLPYDKCGRYTFMPQLAPVLHRPGLRVRRPGRARQVPLGGRDDALRARGRGRLRHARVDRRASPGPTAASACSATPTTATRSGRPWRAATPALKAIVPRVTERRPQGLGRWWGDSVVELYGADYLAHYWVDQTYLRLLRGGLEPPPAGGGL